MAQFRTYKCQGCGQEVHSEPQGHYALMSGEYYQFSCKDCKEIVSISAREIAEMEYAVCCPECGSKELSTWNPIEGRCPKCGFSFKVVPAPILMAD